MCLPSIITHTVNSENCCCCFKELQMLITIPSFGAIISCVCLSWSGLDSVSVWWRQGSWWKWRRWSTKCERNKVVLLTSESWPHRVWPTWSWICFLDIDLTTMMKHSNSLYPKCTNFLPAILWYFRYFHCCVLFHSIKSLSLDVS